LVVVAFVAVKPPLNARLVVVALLGKRYEKSADVRHVPLIAKQPPARLMPPVE
jgi:hypothetical protein